MVESPDMQVRNLLAERAKLEKEAAKISTRCLAAVFKNQAEALHQSRLRLMAIAGELHDLSVQPVSDAALEQIGAALFPNAAAETKESFYVRARSRRYAMARLEDMPVNRTDVTGSRGSGAAGYFQAQDAQGSPVVLYRGWDGAGEQADLLMFLDGLAEKNPRARTFLPALLGKAEIEGKSYLVMEDLMATHMRANHHHITKEEFLRQAGDIFTPGFRKTIEQWGLDLGRTTLERDYIFVAPDGGVRLGIPFRAADYIADAPKIYAGLATPAAPAPANTTGATL